jgi:hypothetical protein
MIGTAVATAIQALVLVLLAGGNDSRSAWRRVLPSSLVVTLLLALNQAIVMFFVSVAFLTLMKASLCTDGGLGIRRARRLASATLGGLLGYALLASLVTRALPDVGRSGRFALLGISDLGSRAEQVGDLIRNIWVAGEPLVASPTKRATLFLLVVLFVFSFVTRRGAQARIRYGTLSLLAIVGVVVLTPGANAITPLDWWWPVPRTLVHVPLSLALFVGILLSGLNSDGESRRIHGKGSARAAVIGGVSVVGAFLVLLPMLSSSHTVLHD